MRCSLCCALSFMVLAAGFAAEPAKVTWNHNPSSQTGPQYWGSLSPEYATCGSRSADKFVEVGVKETPINIETGKAVRAALPDLIFRYHDTPLDIENTGHVIEVPYEEGSHFRPGRSVTDDFQLVQFHLHAPSEHTIDGRAFDAELHLVHSNIVGDLAVVGVLLKRDAGGNSALDQVIANAPNTVTAAKMEGVSVNARDLLPKRTSYYAYTGSLTTPPCGEGVRWFVLTEPVNISGFSLQYLHTLISMFPGYENYPNNNRPVVPLNSRKVLVVP